MFLVYVGDAIPVRHAADNHYRAAGKSERKKQASRSAMACPGGTALRNNRRPTSVPERVLLEHAEFYAVAQEIHGTLYVDHSRVSAASQQKWLNCLESLLTSTTQLPEKLVKNRLAHLRSTAPAGLLIEEPAINTGGEVGLETQVDPQENQIETADEGHVEESQPEEETEDEADEVGEVGEETEEVDESEEVEVTDRPRKPTKATRVRSRSPKLVRK